MRVQVNAFVIVCGRYAYRHHRRMVVIPLRADALVRAMIKSVTLGHRCLLLSKHVDLSVCSRGALDFCLWNSVLRSRLVMVELPRKQTTVSHANDPNANSTLQAAPAAAKSMEARRPTS